MCLSGLYCHMRVDVSGRRYHVRGRHLFICCFERSRITHGVERGVWHEAQRRVPCTPLIDEIQQSLLFVGVPPAELTCPPHAEQVLKHFLLSMYIQLFCRHPCTTASSFFSSSFPFSCYPPRLHRYSSCFIYYNENGNFDELMRSSGYNRAMASLGDGV